MKYGNKDELQHDCIATPEEPMAAMMSEVGAIAGDVLLMVQRINIFVSGKSNSHDCTSQKDEAPKCFRDEIAITRGKLLATAQELRRITDDLGI